MRTIHNTKLKWRSLPAVLCLVLLLAPTLLLTCQPPAQAFAPGEEAPLEQSGEETPQNVNIYYYNYPGSEITFLDEFSLFSTQVVLSALDTELAAFELSLDFDDSRIQYESVFGPAAVVEGEAADGRLTVRSLESRIGPGENLELCRITWKATATCFESMPLTVNSLVTAAGTQLTPPPVYTSLLKVVERIGSLRLVGENYLEEGSEFTQALRFDTAEKNIVEYDIDIVFDPQKIEPRLDLAEAGVVVGSDGFADEITAYPGWLHITGSSAAGTGSGTDLAFLLTSWRALDSGRTSLGLSINKMVTADEVYIKPAVRGNPLSIYVDDNSPVVDVWFDPDLVTVATGEGFMTKLVLNTTGYNLASYGINILYDETVLALDQGQAGGQGITAGSDGFLTAFNAYEDGIIQVTGFDVTGKDPDTELELLDVYWQAVGESAQSAITLEVDVLTDNRYRPIERVRIFDCEVTVTAP